MQSPPTTPTVHAITASALWGAAITLIGVSTFGVEEHRLAMTMFAWSVLVGLVACVSTVWLIVDRIVQREQEKTAVKVAAAVARAVVETDVRRIG